MRTGWNSQETNLTYSNVNSSSFGLLTVVPLSDPNDQVDTQPLIVPNLQISGGKHDVVYVATEANNIYAFDANTGVKLNMKNLGPPVLQTIGCIYQGPYIGISGTPVIDLPNNTMYVIAYTYDSSKSPSYSIHALDLATLNDKVTAKPITATHTLSDGKTPFSFNAGYQRQRPGLLLANGNVYAGFGSFCDFGGGLSRGWLLGWKAGSLIPLSANELNNSQLTAPTTVNGSNGMFLSSVWMSGYGIAGDQNGSVYFSTGNSDPSGTTYDGVSNVQHSVLKLNSDLTRPSSFLFTPDNVGNLDVEDLDVGSGGVMLLPSQAGPVPDMAVATAKDGRMFLLNRDNLGGRQANDAGALDAANVGSGCWCGPTYFNDGTPHIVSSGGIPIASPPAPSAYSQNNVMLWNLQTSPKPRLVQTATGNMPDTVQDPGFFTTVSSNGNNNAIIWAVSRPQTNPQNTGIWLCAFKATPTGTTLPPLYQSKAGSWPAAYLNGNANTVPVVANGKVYVASHGELDIFGLVGAQGAKKVTAVAEAHAEVRTQFPGPELVKEEHQISGYVRKVDGNHLTVETRDNKTVVVDATQAQQSFHYSVVAVGKALIAGGSYDSKGVLQAVYVLRAKPSSMAWPPDR
jgi:hypothetical protein